MSHPPETNLELAAEIRKVLNIVIYDSESEEEWRRITALIDAWVREREAEAAIAAVQVAAINGCYCVCHSQSSSRPACVHCRPEGFIETADPYCGLTAKGVERILALATTRKQLEESKGHTTGT